MEIMKSIYLYKLTDANGNVKITAVDEPYTVCYIGGFASDGANYGYEHEEWGSIPEWVHRHGMKLEFCKIRVNTHSLDFK